MANVFVTPSMVAKEAVRMLENNLVMGNLVHRDYVKEWQGDEKIGGSVTIKAPMYARVKDGATMDEVDLLERSFTLTVGTRKHVAHVITAQEMTLDFDAFSSRFIRPAMEALANYVDLDVLSLYKKIYNQVGTPGTTPNQYYTFAQAYQRLTEEGCPSDQRRCVISPAATARMSDTLKGLFHREIVGNAVQRAKLPMLAGMEVYESNNVNTHTVGTWAADSGSILINGAATDEDTTLSLDTITGSATVLEGDLFTVANVNAVNPISGQSTGSLRQHVVRTTTAADGGGAVAALACIPGSDPYKIRSSTSAETYLPYQNIDTLHANEAAVTVVGTTGQQYPVNMAFHKNAFALVTVPLTLPASVSWKARANHKGLSIRVVRDYDVTNDQEYIRFDILYGIEMLNPALACRIAG